MSLQKLIVRNVGFLLVLVVVIYLPLLYKETD